MRRLRLSRSLRRRQRHLAEFDGPVIPLQEDGPRRALIAVEGAARDPGNLLPVDDALVVEVERERPPDERDVERLPLAGLLGGVDAGREEAVDAADLVAVGVAAEVVLDLHLVAAAEVDAAVA